MGWGKTIKQTMCEACQGPITEGQTACECGRPTVYMSFQDRTRFEVEQYKAWKERQTA